MILILLSHNLQPVPRLVVWFRVLAQMCQYQGFYPLLVRIPVSGLAHLCRGQICPYTPKAIETRYRYYKGLDKPRTSESQTQNNKGGDKSNGNGQLALNEIQPGSLARAGVGCWWHMMCQINNPKKKQIIPIKI
jgi:hypothetical protein